MSDRMVAFISSLRRVLTAGIAASKICTALCNDGAPSLQARWMAGTFRLGCRRSAGLRVMRNHADSMIPQNNAEVCRSQGDKLTLASQRECARKRSSGDERSDN